MDAKWPLSPRRPKTHTIIISFLSLVFSFAVLLDYFDFWSRGGDPGGVGGVRTLPEIKTSYLRRGQGGSRFQTKSK